ncbi:MAG: hypothetical protein ACT4P7_01490 [Gemmatimonadaceae bacterium]
MSVLDACGARSIALVVAAAVPHMLSAQHDQHPADSTRRLTIGAMAVALYSRATPGVLKQPVSEGYLTQPMGVVAARTFNGRLVAYLSINAEGATLDRGEINPGVYGEGYADRRHPHTWLHEAMLGVTGRSGAVAGALFAGKGFVPYGSDDPMGRPFVKYPVNHHHAQILERLMVAATLRVNDLSIEVASFNGDEPESPSDWPNADRAFDSWSARASWTPARVFELSASLADVQSPEFARGDGLDQKKHSVSMRLHRVEGAWRYGLVEYARTREFSDGRQAFEFSAVLAEGELRVSSLSFAARFERTTRPEEERTTSFYRTIRPLLDFNILGRTRWTNVTVNLSPMGWGTGLVTGRPFVEVGYHVPRATLRPSPFDPVEVFGDDQIWMVSLGVRLHAGSMRRRFGRYGLGA